MYTFRVSAAAAVVGAILSLTGQVSAMGLGRATQRAVLGENLAMSVPVRLESGEDLSSECVAADVFFGDDKLAPQQVSVSLEGTGAERMLRIATRSVVNEPVVAVYAVVGCQSRISRKFVVFADPPSFNPVADVPDAAVMALPPARPPVRSRERDVRAAEPSLKSAPGAPSASTASAPRSASRPAAPSASRNSLRTSPVPRETLPEKSAARPRLVLDPAEVDAMIVPGLQWSMGMEAPADSPEVLQRRAAAAALWTALNATPEQQQKDRVRLEELQARLVQMQRDLEGARSRMAQVEAAAPETGRVLQHPLVQGLSLLALALTGALVWLWRRQAVATRQQGWWQEGDDLHRSDDAREPSSTRPDDTHETDEAGQGPTTPTPLTALTRQPVHPSAQPRSGSGSDAASAGAPKGSPVAEPPRAAAPVPVMSTGPVSMMNTVSIQLPVPQEAPRELSVEELIDLEQQAEFFVVLGQDDAAIELLESHVQSAGAVSPLPYLKLLELYRRLDRRADYERSRDIFNARFNAYAPSWNADLQDGHHLEDYAGVIGRLEGLWSRPAKAMEVIGASLMRADESHETFDLPAYRELLFLYSVARDLAERPHVRADDAPPSVFQELEPLMATRPVRAAPQALPPINLDLSLDESEGVASDGPPPDSTDTPEPVKGNVIEFEDVHFKRPESGA